MKKLIIAAAVFAAAVPALAQNVNISIGQPGYYGHITIGDFAPPPVYYTQPVIVERQVQYVGQPVYLRVPPGHRKHWSRYCRQYNACGQQVFFVQDDWYNRTYAPRYVQEHPRFVREQPRYVVEHPRYVAQQRVEYRGGDDHGHGYDKHDKRDKHDDRGHDDGHDNGHGNGHGHGHDHD